LQPSTEIEFIDQQKLPDKNPQTFLELAVIWENDEIVFNVTSRSILPAEVRQSKTDY
jgi:hypothetical protein